MLDKIVEDCMGEALYNELAKLLQISGKDE